MGYSLSFDQPNLDLRGLLVAFFYTTISSILYMLYKVSNVSLGAFVYKY